MTDAFSLLCTGDLHIGRHPTRIPEHDDGEQFSPAHVWQEIVQRAVADDVDLVLLSGDVIDRDNRYYEAYGPLERGLRQLSEEDIHVVAVGGNHDYDALPRLLQRLGETRDNVHLLGSNGTWEHHVHERGDGGSIVVDGWSFPSGTVHRSPLHDRSPLEERGLADEHRDAPRVGLLHADLDQPESKYAPVESARLREGDVDAWILGHIHHPAERSQSSPPILYPGSPQPLDPGETGLHGPWLVEVSPQGSVEMQQVPLATLRYETTPVQVDGSATVEEVSEQITATLDNRVQAIRDEMHTTLRHVVFRLSIEGATEAYGDLPQELNRLEEQLRLSRGSVTATIDKADNGTQPPLDLEELAGQTGPMGEIADILLALDDGDPGEHADLLRDTEQRLQKVFRANAYQPLRVEGESTPDREQAAEHLQRAGRQLLGLLQEQREAQR